MLGAVFNARVSGGVCGVEVICLVGVVKGSARVRVGFREGGWGDVGGENSSSCMRSTSKRGRLAGGSIDFV